jgi:hypothetical protein
MIYFYSLNPEELYTETDGNLNRHISSIRRQAVLNKGDFDSLLSETENLTKLMIYDGAKSYFTSLNLMSTMDRFGLKGSFLSQPDVSRDTIIARQFKKGHECTLVSKSCLGVSKLFAILSGKYQHVDQTILLNIVDTIGKSGNMGTPVCREWELTHFMTSLFIEFPEKAKEIADVYGLKDEMIPGIWLATSDTGDCSIKIRGTWRLKNSIILNDEVSHKHIGNVCVSKIIKDVETTIFDKYTMLPETLCELMLQVITDPSWDLTMLGAQELNRKRIENVLRNTFKQLGVVKVIGNKNHKKLLADLISEFDSSLCFTAYDIAIAIMALPEKVTGLKTNKDEFRKICGKAPYVKYEADDEEASIVLIA